MMQKQLKRETIAPDAAADGGGARRAAGPGRFPVERFAHLVFDCDGVLVDTNGVKEGNIRHAARRVCDEETAERFVRFFVGNNGLPREAKIAAFFADPLDRREVLEEYNRLNAVTLHRVRPAPETVAFLERCAREGARMYVLSGGDQPEVRALLEAGGVAGLFEEILGGPTTKDEHLQRLGLEGAVCYFGDSRYDFEVAARFGFHFVFLTRYTQFAEWEGVLAGRAGVEIMEDFRSLNG